MGNPIEDAEAAIRDLARRKMAGEIDDDEFREQSLPHAAIIAGTGESQADRWRGILTRAIDFAEGNPAAVQAVIVGAAFALRHYLRSTEAGE